MRQICRVRPGVASHRRLGYNPPLPLERDTELMYAVLLTIEVVVCIAMIGVILLQRSEGGGLGMGGGGGMGGLMTGRGAANVLTRTTVILATIFITTSIALTIVAKNSRKVGPLDGATSTSTPLGTLPPGSTAPAAPAQPSPTPVPVTAPPPATPAPAPATPAPAPTTPAAPP
jgi:preprotein translocase subunit SecG